MKNTYIAIAFITALTAVSAGHAQTSVTPLISADATYTDTGYKADFAPKGYKLGGGLTLGALINQHHEISLSTGITKWTGDKNVQPGIGIAGSDSEQIPVLLNYRYHLPLDKKGRYSLFAGPTIGFIHEKFTFSNTNLGGLPPALIGDSSDSAWRFAYGATVGFTADLGKGWDLSFAAQALHLNEHTYSNTGGLNTFDIKSATRPSFAVSVGYSW